MTTSGFDEKLVPVSVEVDDIFIHLKTKGGLAVDTPTLLFPRLSHATAEQRAGWRLIGQGDGIHWPEIDEDISVRVLIRLAEAVSSTEKLSEVA